MNIIEKHWKYKDLDCIAVANPMGHRCGYVRIPEGNRFFNLGVEDSVFDATENLDRLIQESFVAMLSCLGRNEKIKEFSKSLDGIIEVHGGITFSEIYTLENIPGLWIGFDCAHCNDLKDLSLVKNEEIKKIYEDFNANMWIWNLDDCKMWTLEMVIAETEKLAEQVYNQKGNYEK